MKTIKLGIADEHRIFRDILKSYLSQQESFEPVLEADSASDLFNKLQLSNIEVLVIDILSSSMGGSETLNMIRTEFPDIKVIVLSMSEDLFLINELLDIGIHAFISKADPPEHLLQAIVSAAKGEMYRNKFLIDALYSIHTSLPRNSKNSNVLLNEREKRIIQMLWEEKSNKDIADEIFLSVRSVEKIRQDLKEKLGAKSTIGLIKYALTNKIIASGNRVVAYS
jgi:DNA-binding NarL/FixJ family response regulator